MENIQPGTRKVIKVELIEAVDSTSAQYYIDVRSGVKDLNLLHMDLAHLTTNGIFCYQEQIMAFLVEIAGYSLEEADQIRGAIAKKKHEVIMASFERIRAGCRARGWNEDAIETVCQQIQAFARYSFNRSHSRAYSELGYITMWLKRHYRLEWWTAVLNTVDSEDKRRHFMSILNDDLLPPSVNNAFDRFMIKEDKIATPISAVKGVGGAALQELSAKAPFSSLNDYVDRIIHSKVNAGHVSALIKARAFDCMFDTQATYIAARDMFINEYMKLRKMKASTAASLLDMPSNHLEIFLAEKEFNTCFNKKILDNPAIVDHIVKWWPGFVPLGKRDIPLRMGDSTFVLSGVDIAQKFLDLKLDRSFGMIMLYGGSSYKTGQSKRSGRTWHKLDVTLSDGYTDVECAWWDKMAPLKWPKNSLVYIKGKLKPGYKTPVSFEIEELDLIENIGDRNDEICED